MTDYVSLVRLIAEQMVEDPSAVSVESYPHGEDTVVSVSVAEGDMGRMVGKRGRNIGAIRTVVRAAGTRNHERVYVEIPDDEEDTARDA